MTDQSLIALAAAHCTEQGDCFIFSEKELLAFAAALTREQEAQPASEREDAARYRLLRRGQHWSVIDGIGDTLRAEQLDAAIDAERLLAAQPAAQEPPSIETAPWLQVSGYSGGAHPDGLYAHVTLEINGKLVEYVRAAQPAAQEPVSLIERFDWHMRGVAAVFPKETQVVVLEHACAVLAAALAREQAAQPARYWSIADDANKCIHKPHCLATSKEMQALRLKVAGAAQPAAQEPSWVDVVAWLRANTNEFGAAERVEARFTLPTEKALEAQPAAQEPK